MSVGASSIKRAAKAGSASAEPKETVKPDAIMPEAADEKESKEGAEPVKKAGTAGKPGKAGRKPAEKARSAKKPEQKEPAGKPEQMPAAKSGYEAYGIGQQLPVHLL